MTELPSRKVLQKSNLWYGGSFWHRVAMAVCEVVALSKGYQSIDASVYRDAGFQPDLVIRIRDKFSQGPKRYGGWVTYGIEIIDTHGPVENYARKAGFDDILPIRRKDLMNPDSIDDLRQLAERTIP